MNRKKYNSLVVVAAVRTSSSFTHRHRPLPPLMKLILHLIDGSFSPLHSSLTAIEPINARPAQHVLNLPVGRGEQTIKWLTLAAQQRLRQLHQHHGRVRQREPILGSSAAFIPCGINKNDNNQPNETTLDPYAQINECFDDGDDVYIVFNQQMGCEITDWGKSTFYRNRFVEYEDEPVPEVKNGEPKPTPLIIRDPSMFFERIFECDSQSTIETRPLMDRSFEADWKFHVKKPRFMERQPRTIRERMRGYYPRIKAIYSYYAASSSEGSPFTLNMSEMRGLMNKCDLPFKHLDILWAETNYEAVKDDDNADRELARFEFVEICIRLAFEHFVPPSIKNADRATKDKALVQALCIGLVELMDEHLLPQAWRGIPHARFFADPDAFRRERMYNEPVNRVLLERCDDLYSLFCAYARVTQQREGNVVGGEHSPSLVGYREFMDMCRVGGLISGAGGSSTGTKKKTKSKLKKGENVSAGGDETLKTARIAFALCQMTVVDELRRSRRRAAVDTHQHATFVEFLEALSRLADMRADPKGNDPKYQLSVALGELVDRIIAAHEQLNFWSMEGNAKRLWREYKKKFGQSRNAVKRRGHGPEVGVQETTNSSKQVLKRRVLSTEGVFGVGGRTLQILNRKFTGGVVTQTAKKEAEQARAEAVAEAEEEEKKREAAKLAKANKK